MFDFDAVVIGGGSAGLAFAKRAARLGASCLLVEKKHLGGTCVNRGCVPKKLLWDAAWLREQQAAAGMTAPSLSFEHLRKSIQEKIVSIRSSFADDLEQSGVKLVRGSATVSKSGDVVQVGDKTYRTNTLVLACGARPSPLDIDGAEFSEDSNDVLSWTEIPQSIIFLGGGYIGCELASIFAAFGASTTIVDPGERLLTQFDAEVVSQVEDICRDRGIGVALGAQPTAITRDGDLLTLHLDSGETMSAERVVAAIGRTPNIATLGEIESALDVADTGALSIDDRFQTSVSGVYAIGDIADRLPLTPVATRDGERLAEMLFGDTKTTAIDLSLVASAAFVMPPVAQVGTLDNAQACKGHDLASGALVSEDHWTARTLRKIASSDGSTVGAAFMASSAADMIAPFAALVAHDKDNPAQAATGVHPTFGEENVGR